MIVETSTLSTTKVDGGNLATLRDILANKRHSQADHNTEASKLFWSEDDQLIVNGNEYDITDVGFAQLCGKLRAPADFVARLDPDLRATTLNRLLSHSGKDVMVRTEGDRVRGVLGPRYAAVSNLDLVTGLMAQQPNALARYTLSESALDLQVIGRNEVQDLVPGSRLKLGTHITNSEVGLAKLRIEGLVVRTICLNGMIFNGGTGRMERVHRGDGDDLLREALNSLGGFDPAPETVMAQFRKAYEIDISAHGGEKVIDRIASARDLTKAQADQSKAGLGKEPGNRMYHVLQALTWAGTHGELGQDAKRQLITVGGQILDNIDGSRSWLN